MQQAQPARCPSRPDYRTVATAFAIGLAVGVMAREFTRPAHAQIPDPAQQRLDMNQGIAQLNGQVAELLTVLRTGTLKVRVMETDKTGGAGPRISFESDGTAGATQGSGPAADWPEDG
jgi:hypothetical protein